MTGAKLKKAVGGEKPSGVYMSGMEKHRLSHIGIGGRKPICFLFEKEKEHVAARSENFFLLAYEGRVPDIRRFFCELL